MLGRFTKEPGKIVVLTGSRIARDHIERRLGFDLALTEDFPHLQAIPSVEGRDDPKVIEAVLPKIFAQHPDIRGIYSSAAGNGGLLRFQDYNQLRDKNYCHS